MKADTLAGTATYPRAVVVRQADDDYHIQIWHSEASSELATDKAGMVRTFSLLRSAIGHAQREVHALRSRRHPAGQPWLKESGHEHG